MQYAKNRFISRAASTLAQAVEAHAAQRPNGQAVIAPQQGIEWSYEEFNNTAKSLSVGLTELGYKAGLKPQPDLDTIACQASSSLPPSSSQVMCFLGMELVSCA